jgi:hypothetical protein
MFILSKIAKMSNLSLLPAWRFLWRLAGSDFMGLVCAWCSRSKRTKCGDTVNERVVRLSEINWNLTPITRNYAITQLRANDE